MVLTNRVALNRAFIFEITVLVSFESVHVAPRKTVKRFDATLYINRSNGSYLPKQRRRKLRPYAAARRVYSNPVPANVSRRRDPPSQGLRRTSRLGAALPVWYLSPFIFHQSSVCPLRHARNASRSNAGGSLREILAFFGSGYFILVRFDPSGRAQRIEKLRNSKSGS
jgi:hypothetical protein